VAPDLPEGNQYLLSSWQHCQTMRAALSLDREAVPGWFIASIASAIAFFLGAAPWWTTQFPAAFTLDTCDQVWQACEGKELNTFHSLLMTLTFRLLRCHLGWYALLQYVLISLTVGFCLVVAVTGYRLSRRPQIAPAVVASFILGMLPGCGFLIFQLVKDIPFGGAALLAATVMAIVIVERRHSRPWGIAWGALSVLPWFFRHDGVFIALFFAIAALVVARRWRAWQSLFLPWLAGFVLLSFAGVLLPLVSSAGAGPMSYAYAMPFVWDVSGILARHERLEADDLRFIRQWAEPERLRAEFHETHGDDTFLEYGIPDFNWLAEHKAEFFKGWWRIIRNHPRDFWVLRWVRFGHIYGLRRLRGDPIPQSEVLPGRISPMHTVLFGASPRRFLLWASVSRKAEILLWSAIWPLLALALIAAIALRKNLALALFAAIPVAQALVFSQIVSTSIYRYNFYIWPFLMASLLCVYDGLVTSGNQHRRGNLEANARVVSGAVPLEKS
jgi:hypothetical protein